MPGAPGPVLETEGAPGHVPETEGVPGRVPETEGALTRVPKPGGGRDHVPGRDGGHERGGGQGQGTEVAGIADPDQVGMTGQGKGGGVILGKGGGEFSDRTNTSSHCSFNITCLHHYYFARIHILFIAD